MDREKPQKAFEETIADLKELLRRQDLNPVLLDSMPEDFGRLDRKHLMYLWHFLTDKSIAELYGVSAYAVKKRRLEFDINPATSAFDRMYHEMNGWNDL